MAISRDLADCSSQFIVDFCKFFREPQLSSFQPFFIGDANFRCFVIALVPHHSINDFGQFVRRGTYGVLAPSP